MNTKLIKSNLKKTIAFLKYKLLSKQPHFQKSTALKISFVIFILSLSFHLNGYTSEAAKSTPEMDKTTTTPSSTQGQSKDNLLIEKHTKDTIDKEQETRKQMMNWSRHLGVTCIYCHNQDNFKSDEKSAFKKAQKHWQMVRLINEEVFTERDKGGNLKVEADCYMCHRGLSVPDFREPPQNLTK